MDGRNVYDKLVKPDKPITDYLTRFSGMDEERLSSVTTKLIDVQKDLSGILSSSTILLGHSLECDLRVLKLVHPHVIDTSVIYQHPRGPPFKASLKWLAQKWLKKEIQRGGQEGGHDSEEDARTCVELLKLKMQKGALPPAASPFDAYAHATQAPVLASLSQTRRQSLSG